MNPPYGTPPPTPAMPPVPAPIDPRALRPRRLWFWIGGAIIAFGVGTGLIAGVLSTALTTVPLPQFVAESRDGAPMELEINKTAGADRVWQFYASRPLARPEIYRCQFVSPPGSPGGIWFEPALPSDDFEPVETESNHWYLLATIHFENPGPTTLRCEPGADYGVAYGPRPGGFFTGLFRSPVVAIVPPLLGTVIGAVVIIVTAVRRNGHRRRLLSGSAPGYPPPMPMP